VIHVPENCEAIIFDCDGTLVDNMPLHLQSWQKAFAEYEAEFTPQFLVENSGRPLIETVETFNSQFGTELDPKTVAELKAQYFEELMHGADPIELVCELAREYHGKLPMSVVSGSDRHDVDIAISIAGLNGIFVAILTADDPIEPKPAPDLFLEAAKVMGVSPEKCVVFEDGDSGIQAATAAGMVVIDVNPVVDLQRKCKVESEK